MDWVLIAQSIFFVFILFFKSNMEFNALKESGIFDLFSDFGKEVSQPPGIIEWSARAKNESEINATVGVATGAPSEYLDSSSNEIGIFHLSKVQEQFNNFKPDQIFGYSPVLGIPKVRDNWKKWIAFKLKDQNPGLEPIMTRPMAIPGLTMGIYILSRMFLSPGEKAVIPEKRWGNYDAIIKKNVGAGIQSFPLFRDNSFNCEGMKEAIIETAKNQDKTFVLLNFPNNPTGYSPDNETAKKICETLQEAVKESGKPLVVVTDDAYEGFVYDRALKYSIFSHLAELGKDILAIKVDGITKELLFWGGRLGMITFALPSYFGDKEKIEAELENKFVGFIRSTISNSTRVIQEGAAAIVTEPENFLDERKRIVTAIGKRAIAFKEELDKNPCSEVVPDPFNSGFFAFLNIKDIPAEKLADHLLKKYKIGIIPVEKKNENINGIRVTFSSVVVEDMPRLVAGINNAVADLKKKIE